MSEEIFSVEIEALAAGLAPGLNDLAAPFWFDGSNMAFDLYGVHTENGMEALFWTDILFSQHAGMFASASGLFSAGSGAAPSAVTITGEPCGLAEQLKFNGVRVVFIGTMDKLWRSDGVVAPDDVSGSSAPYTGRSDSAAALLATRWSMIFWNEWCLATNGIDAPQVYKTGPDFVDLNTESQFTTAEIFAVLGPHVLALGTDNNPKEVLGCAEGNPEAWDPTLYATATQLVMRELTSRIIAAVPLGRALAVYGTSNMQLLNYVGSWVVIGQSTTALVGPGAVSKRSVVPIGSQNYGLQKNGVFVTDGVSFQMVSYPALGDWLARNVNWDQAAKIWGRYNPAEDTIKWSMPLVGSSANNAVLTLNRRTGAFGLNSTELSFNCGTDPQEFGKPVVAKSNGSVGFGDTGNDYFGAALARSAETKWLDLGKRGLYKYIDLIEIDLKIISGSGPSLSFKSRREDTADIQTYGPFVLNDELNSIPVDAAGFFFKLEFSSTGANDAWELGGVKFFGTLDETDAQDDES